MNKTKCIRVMPLALPDRDLKGGIIASDSPEFKAQQEEVFREKLAYLKQKTVSGECAYWTRQSKDPTIEGSERVCGAIEGPEESSFGSTGQENHGHRGRF